jgi:hypothetical protein
VVGLPRSREFSSSRTVFDYRPYQSCVRLCWCVFFFCALAPPPPHTHTHLRNLTYLQAEWRDSRARKAGEALRIAEQAKTTAAEVQQKEQHTTAEAQFLEMQRVRLMAAAPCVREARKALVVVRSGRGTDGLEVTASLRMLHKVRVHHDGLYHCDTCVPCRTLQHTWRYCAIRPVLSCTPPVHSDRDQSA